MHDDVTPEAWLRSRAPERPLGSSAKRVLDHLLTHPMASGFEHASDIAATIGVSTSSVTRMAQQLGFDGWPALQRELRARTLARLSMRDVSDIHGVTDTPFQHALRHDNAALGSWLRGADEGAIARIAHRLQSADRILVAAMGSFAAVGHALAHNLLIAGYPVQPQLDAPGRLANTVAGATAGDVLVFCSYWRHYRVVVDATRVAHRNGAAIVAIADYLPGSIATIVDDAVLIPAEGTSFFASLTIPMAVQQGIVATLARLEPDRVRASIDAAERTWDELDLLVDPRADDLA